MWKGGRCMEGKLIVISGFSGAGKGTVIRRMMQEHEGYALSVSMTTRKPREGETDGVEYHFVTNEVFEDLVRRDGLLEHAGFVDNYYGTPSAFVEENRRAGRDVLLEIEVQGAMQIREKFPETLRPSDRVGGEGNEAASQSCRGSTLHRGVSLSDHQ